MCKGSLLASPFDVAGVGNPCNGWAIAQDAGLDNMFDNTRITRNPGDKTVEDDADRIGEWLIYGAQSGPGGGDTYKKALQAASSSRFEHGESGAT
jgi:hypothetical protein